MNEKLESLENIQQELDELKKIDWENESFDYLVERYNSNILSVPVMPYKVKKGTILFRGRMNEGIEFNNINQIGLKPKEKVHTFGRANLPKQAVFYCSTNQETVAREVTQWYVSEERFEDIFSKGVVRKGWSPFTSFMTISAWLVEEDLDLGLIFNCDVKKISKSIQDTFIFTEELSENDRFILNFFSSEFGRTDVKFASDYYFTAFYANEIFKMNYDGVIYSSVANNYRGDNIALSNESMNKVRFLGANDCYIFNEHYNKDKPLDDSSTTSIARDRAAIVDENGGIQWIDATDDCDYIVDYKGEKLLFLLSPTGIVTTKATVKIKA